MSVYELSVPNGEEGTSLGNVHGPLPRVGDTVIVHSKRLTPKNRDGYHDPFIAKVTAVVWEVNLDDVQERKMVPTVHLDHEYPEPVTVYCDCQEPQTFEDQRCTNCGGEHP